MLAFQGSPQHISPWRISTDKGSCQCSTGMGLAQASTGSSTLHNDNEPNCEFFYGRNRLQLSQLQQISYFEPLSSRVMMEMIRTLLNFVVFYVINQII